MNWIKRMLSKLKLDKVLHFVCGLLIAQFAFAFFSHFFGMWAAASFAFLTATAASTAKEAIDVKYGCPSWADFFATEIGAIVGLAPMLLVFV